MTREEAIAELKKGRPKNWDLHRDIVAFDEAVDMAVEALEQEPCEDAISRQAAIDMATTIETDDFSGNEIIFREIVDVDDVKALPSVKPQYTDDEIQRMQEMQQAEIEKAYELGKAEQPKTGHWIWTLEDWNKWECSECGFTKRTDVHVSIGYKFCPHCGAKMETETLD